MPRAAVLLILYMEKGEYRLILTKRTRKVEYHRGDVSFPGGRYDKDDKTLENTALRESFEEIGVKPEDVKILGSLNEVKTRTSNYTITPFVATIPFHYTFRGNDLEVEEIVKVPISFFLDTKNYKNNRWLYKGHEIWGATARILNKFLRKWKRWNVALGGQRKTGK